MGGPNIVVFFTDQQRWDTLGACGNPAGLTPNLDWYARKGTLMQNAFTPQPVCGPARCCLQTSLYATETGCFSNATTMAQNHKTMGHYFSENGYHTAYIGKWHMDDQQVIPKQNRRGYQYWRATNLLEFSSDAYDTVLFDEDNQPVKLPGYRVDALTDEAIRFINNEKDTGKPFFLFCSFLEPHPQNYNYGYPAPLPYSHQYQNTWMPPDLAKLIGNSPGHLPGYMGMVKRLDEAYGRLMDALKSLDLIDDTIVLFTSDHGDHFLTRNTTGKMSGHESSIHIPMVIHGPHFKGGQIIEKCISLIDVMPTLLDCVGIKPDTQISGRSFLPLLNNHNSSAVWDDEIFIQVSEASLSRVLRTPKWKYIVSANGDIDPLKDKCASTYVEAELYDLENDPYELINLISHQKFDDVKQELRKRLLNSIVIRAHEELPEILPAESGQLPRGILPQMFTPQSSDLQNLSDGWRYAPKNMIY